MPCMSTVDSTGMLEISSSVSLLTAEGTTSCTVPCESFRGKKYSSFPTLLEPRESLMRIRFGRASTTRLGSPAREQPSCQCDF